MKKLIVLSILGLLPTLVFAQLKEQTRPVNISQALRQPLGVGRAAVGMLGLNPDNLNISQSYEMSFLSAGGHSFSQGLYLNTLSYQFSIPLQVSLQWGVAHQPMGSMGASPVFQNGPFLSHARLRYQPKENMTIHLEFQQMPRRSSGWMSPYGIVP